MPLYVFLIEGCLVKISFSNLISIKSSPAAKGGGGGGGGRGEVGKCFSIEKHECHVELPKQQFSSPSVDF